MLFTVNCVFASPVDGFVFHIKGPINYIKKSDGINKGMYTINTEVPNSSCSVELTVFLIKPALESDELGFSGRVESLACKDPDEKRLYSGKGGVTGSLTEDKTKVSELMLSLWFF